MKLKNIDRRVLYEIYTDRDDDERFNVGYIVYNDDTYLLLKSIEPYGNFDGYDLILAEDVYRIAYGTDYLCGIEALANVTFECDYDFGKLCGICGKTRTCGGCCRVRDGSRVARFCKTS